MQKLHRALLASACLALAAAAGFAPPAQAQSNCSGQANGNCGGGPYTFGKYDVFGAGSSLVAPYWRQTQDCYSESGHSAALITSGSPPTYIDESFFSYTGSPPETCPLGINKNGATVWYISTGSGTGIKGVFSNDPTFYGHVNSGQTQYFPSVFYGLSDAGLGSSDLSVYNSGGTEQGVSFAAPNAQTCGTKNGSTYPNPAQCYGPLIQFPFSIDPVAMFYGGSNAAEQTNGIPGGIYEKWDDSNGNETVYTLNIQYGRNNGSGGLRLSPTTYCAIWNGQITNWNDSRLTADNGGVSLGDPNDPAVMNGTWSVPLIPVGRSDSSGTTSIITRHLANVCSSYSYNKYTTGATTLAAAGANMSQIIGNTYSTSNPNWPGVDQQGKITLAPNSAGVAEYVAFTQLPAGEGLNCPDGAPTNAVDCIQQTRIGYVGPDYVEPYVQSTDTNSYELESATLQNSSSNWESPSPATANTAFGSIQPPQSTKTGKYCSSCTTWGYRDDPTAWVEALSPSEPLANPTASGAYPLVGTTNFLGYTCYATKVAKQAKTLISSLHFVDDNAINYDTGDGILAKAGLSPLPKQWITAIQQTFVANTSGLGLNITSAGAAGACSTVTYGG